MADDVDAGLEAISDDDVVWRRINPGIDPYGDSYAWDYDDRCYRPTSQHFADSSTSPMSVDLGSIARDPAATLKGYEGWGLVAISVREVRRLGLTVESAPLHGNPAHAYVVGKKTHGVRNALKKAAVWVCRLPSMANDDQPPVGG